ncbi:MAG TPA: ABC transporter ATP-binding protein [Polyangiaceae bacterium]
MFNERIAATVSRLENAGEGGWRTLAGRAVRLLGRPGLSALFVGILGSVGIGLVDLVIALFLQLFLQRIGVVAQQVPMPGPLRNYTLSTAALAWGLLGIAFARSLGQYLTTRGGFIAFERMNAQLRRLAIHEMLRGSEQGFVPAALVNARIGETFPKAAWCCFFGSPLVASIAQGGVLMALMTAVAWRESLVSIGGLAVVCVAVLSINRRTRVVAARMPEEQYALTQGIERVARNLLLIRVLRTESREHVRFARSVAAYEDYSKRAHALTAAASNLTPFFALILLLGVVAASQRLLHTQGLALLSFLYLFIRFAQSLAASVQMYSQVNQFFPQLHEALTYASRFSREEFDVALQSPSATETKRDSHARSGLVDRTDPVGPAVRLSGVTYRYPGSDRNAVTDVSATIPAGYQFAVVGPSGSGKSTLLALLLGLMRTDRGTIDIDGRSPADFFRDRAVRVGYVGAEPFLVAGTVRDNICYGLARAIDDDEIRIALDRAHLRAVVDGLPGGLEYPIAEDGSGLSAGQKQRLCLARALLNRPHVLVLDEVSANLDAATESEIAESLRALRGRCTTILVSHRSAILKYADLVLELPGFAPAKASKGGRSGEALDTD